MEAMLPVLWQTSFSSNTKARVHRRHKESQYGSEKVRDKKGARLAEGAGDARVVAKRRRSSHRFGKMLMWAHAERVFAHAAIAALPPGGEKR